jgi:hypothetical protein
VTLPKAKDVGITDKLGVVSAPLIGTVNEPQLSVIARLADDDVVDDGVYDTMTVSVAPAANVKVENAVGVADPLWIWKEYWVPVWLRVIPVTLTDCGVPPPVPAVLALVSIIFEVTVSPTADPLMFSGSGVAVSEQVGWVGPVPHPLVTNTGTNPNDSGEVLPSPVVIVAVRNKVGVLPTNPPCCGLDYWDRPGMRSKAQDR